MAVADSYDAITTDQPNRKGKTMEEGLAEIERCSGKGGDPAVGEAFLRGRRSGRP